MLNKLGGATMANIILKFVKNPKKTDQLVSFYKKRIFFIIDHEAHEVQPDEYWECFVWSEKPKFTLVKPYRKVDPSQVKEEIERVASFNMQLRKVEGYLKNDPSFEKIIFDEQNRPFIKTSLRLKEAQEKFEQYLVKKLDDAIVIRPILDSEDRKEWQRLIQLR